MNRGDARAASAGEDQGGRAHAASLSFSNIPNSSTCRQLLFGRRATAITGAGVQRRSSSAVADSETDESSLALTTTARSGTRRYRNASSAVNVWLIAPR